MPKGEVYNRQEFGGWIREIRKRSGKNVASFGASLVRFREKNGKLESVPYKRVAVTYWEKGEHLPSYTETIAALAIMDYETDQRLWEQTGRYQYVTSCISKYTGKNLYCKNFRDLLILYAAKGIFQVEEIPRVYNELVTILLSDAGGVEKNQEKEYYLMRDTNVLFARLMELDSVEALKEEVKENSRLYSVGYKVVAARLEDIYNRSYRKQNFGMDLTAAVRLYAPAYQDSYKKLTSYELIVSRKWLIGLCMLLHFQREDIDQVLANAQYLPLSEEGYEGWIRTEDGRATGSVFWYEELERRYLKEGGSPEEEDSDFIPLLFEKMTDFSVREKLLFLIVIGCYVLAEEDMPLPMHVLSYLPARADVKKALTAWSEEEDRTLQCGQIFNFVRTVFAEKTRKEEEKAGREELCSLYTLVRGYLKDLNRRIENPGKNLIHGISGETNVNLNEEFHKYYDVPAGKIKRLAGWEEQNDFSQGKYLCAIAYSLFTGYTYKGLPDKKETEAFFAEEGKTKTGITLRFLWELYLGDAPVFEGPHGGVLLKEKDKREMNFARMLLQLADCSK